MKRHESSARSSQSRMTNFLSTDRRPLNVPRPTKRKIPSSPRIHSSPGSRFGLCPLCSKSFPSASLPSHASVCQGDSVTVGGGDGSSFGDCPLCRRTFPLRLLPHHASFCVEEGAIKEEEEEEDDDVGDCRRDGSEASPTFNLVPVKIENCIDSPAPCGNRSLDSDGTLPEVKSRGRESCDSPRHGPAENATDGGSAAVEWWKRRKHTKKVEDEAEALPNLISHDAEPLPGLFHYENFISEEEEGAILAALDGTPLALPRPGKDDDDEEKGASAASTSTHGFLPWRLANFNGPHYGKRWGVHCNLRDRRVDAPENPLPPFIVHVVLPRLKLLAPMRHCVPNEANAIDYRKMEGHYLSSHVDDRQLSLEPIANLSLAGDCYMLFRNEKMASAVRQEQRKGGAALRAAGATGDAPVQMRVFLKRRTLQVLTGKARYDYSHGIRNEDLLSERRVSVTMRQSPLTKR